MPVKKATKVTTEETTASKLKAAKPAVARKAAATKAPKQAAGKAATKGRRNKRRGWPTGKPKGSQPARVVVQRMPKAPIAEVAKKAGVSVQRVYQIRNQLAAQQLVATATKRSSKRAAAKKATGNHKRAS